MLVRFEGVIHGWLVRNSITALRISLGAVFLGFGLLKYFPGASPAGNLTVSTISILTFGLVPDTVALVGTATLECLIGLSLLVGRGLRVDGVSPCRGTARHPVPTRPPDRPAVQRAPPARPVLVARLAL